jgi:hypothetical protein
VPIAVVATGVVAESPVEVLTDVGSAVVFVLDPFPTEDRGQVAHACEVRCRDGRVASSLLERLAPGASVEVAGELRLTRVSAPVEDDLAAVRASIVADSVIQR